MTKQLQTLAITNSERSSPPPLTNTMHIAARLIALSLAALLVSCSNVPPSSNDAAATTAALTAQSERWDKAIVAKDRAAIQANMAEDFRQIDSAGNVETKASFVEGLVAPELKIEPYTVEEFEVRLYGDVALLSGRTLMNGTYEGKAFTTHYRYIDIYVKRDGAWKIVSVQVSKLPK